MEPMIPKAVNAFSEYHAVLSEEKRNELSEKMENRRERITQGRRSFWRFSDESLPPKRSTEKLPTDLT
jgi:hypothetical protein